MSWNSDFFLLNSKFASFNSISFHHRIKKKSINNFYIKLLNIIILLVLVFLCFLKRFFSELLKKSSARKTFHLTILTLNLAAMRKKSEL